MLTAQQVQVRRQTIGASDAPAICGVDPYRNAADVYASKVHEMEPGVENERMMLGNALEPVLMDLAARELGVPVIRRGDRVVGGERLSVTLDGAAELPEGVALVEGKTTGLTAGWGETDDLDDPDAVPKKVLAQTALGLYVTGWQVAYVPVILGRHGLTFKLYKIDRDEELCETVAGACIAFWKNHVEPQVPPPDMAPNLDVLKRIKRVPGKWAEVSNDIGAEVLVAKDLLKTAMAREKAAREALISEMGDADGAETSDYGMWTYFEQARKGYAVEAGSHRVLRHKKPQP